MLLFKENLSSTLTQKWQKKGNMDSKAHRKKNKGNRRNRTFGSWKMFGEI